MSPAPRAPRTHFGRALRDAQPRRPAPRHWLFVPYDQLSADIGPLSHAKDGELGIVMVETTWKPAQRRYHKQKLALILANMRHFALEQARRGVPVRYVASRDSYGATLARLIPELGPLVCMEPAERELWRDVQPHVRFVPHEGWLSTSDDFATLGKPPWRMDAFYRHMRRKTGWLMDRKQPRGGRWSLDTENRKPYKGKDLPAIAPLPTFEPDAVTQEVGRLVRERFEAHDGTLDLATLPATAQDAQELWTWALDNCLPHFGPYEDAMTTASTNLFHSRISAVVNLHRLLPVQVVHDALHADNIDLASLEGFVRQIIGWREFMHHVHVATDGLRRVPTANALDAKMPLPDAYWFKPSGLRCLDTVVRSVWEEGYSHHITRLMVLSNIATLIGASPRELTDWFWIAYVDAYDWVVETNVLGMGTFALGDLMITKPYVSGAAYINRMSDYCRDCAFSPSKTCPITPMYWNFLARHAGRLRGNHRMAIPLTGLSRRSEAQQKRDGRVTRWVQKTLQAGKRLTPDALPD